MALMAKKLFLSLLFIVLSSSVFAGPKNWSEADEYMPIQQDKFCELTNSFREKLTAATKSQNDIKVNLVKKERQEDLDALLPGGIFKDWIVRTKQIRQVDNGDARVEFELPCEVNIGSSKFMVDGKSKWMATIKHDSREYTQLVKLSFGDFAIISGSFIKISEFTKDQKETYYASKPLTSDGGSSSGEFFLASLNYVASAK